MGGEALVLGEGGDGALHPGQRALVGPGHRRALPEGLGRYPAAYLGETARGEGSRAPDDEVGGGNGCPLADQDLAGVGQP